tara:strand:+ start:407 stop:703 length:297 start_codon:yes stop_codon:yes gene_type:complete
MNWKDILKIQQGMVGKIKDKIIRYLKHDSPQGLTKIDLLEKLSKTGTHHDPVKNITVSAVISIDDSVLVQRVDLYLEELINEGNVEYIEPNIYKWVGA